MAEREGFEPSKQAHHPLNCLAGSPVQPLQHLSVHFRPENRSAYRENMVLRRPYKSQSHGSQSAHGWLGADPPTAFALASASLAEVGGNELAPPTEAEANRVTQWAKAGHQ